MSECAFCPSTAALTGEHLWSDWINAVLPKSSYTFVLKRQGQGEKTFQKDELDLKARVVCGDCNHGWMSRIENDEAKPSLSPLIRDTSMRQVSIGTLISIAIFLFKTAVIADHMGTGGTPYFTLEERYRFRETLSIPFGLSMWIGALDHSYRGTFRTLHAVPIAVTENDFGVYVFTYIVGHVVLQLVGAKWASRNPRVILPPKQRDTDSDYMTWFWPIAGSVQWPPRLYVPVRFLNDLTDRWKNSNALS
jgi:hypothetical protein